MPGVKNLPAHQTTRHVPKEPLPIGGITADGRQKIVDTQTGRIKYISRNIPTALDNEGNLTHERF